MASQIPNAEDYPPLSALNDLLFCPRRCFLHRVEGVWVENAHTAAGSLDHRRVHQPKDNDESPYRTARALPLISHALKLQGVADLVEFRPALESSPLAPREGTLRPSSTQAQSEAPEANEEFAGGTRSVPATLVPYPVEYKRGKRRKWDNDEVQLCAQALCLEEMLGLPVPEGAIFSQKSKRRRVVAFTPELRRQTADAAARLHALLAQTAAPLPVLHPKCKECSLYQICLPELLCSPTAIDQAARTLFEIPK